jgi:hypothetical protein
VERFKLRIGSPLGRAGLDLKKLEIDAGERDFWGNKFHSGHLSSVGAQSGRE